MQKTALVVGASGIGGSNLVTELIATGWTVYGLARRPKEGVPGLRAVAVDLLDPFGRCGAHPCVHHRLDASSH
jgi:uncharacterized protein YbjT (DUF2867 family)